ncbi:MAG TPA: DUF2330 domain-containing protein [Thermoanaerobaculia bacterium]|nr:DUF2330 domain-containing protein [Thermoanaerobaculia bacterium]
MQKPRGWFGLVVLLLCSREALACAPAPRMNERVDVVEEAAVIVWEPSTKTEHFIRRASFRGGARDFGFLVPTPSVPTLARVDDDVFDRMWAKTQPQTVYRIVKRIDWTPLLFLLLPIASKGEATTNAGRAPVEVLSTQKVAGYEAAILDATDAAELNAWLTNNGYATTPELTAWLDVYVQQRWIISAFKIDKGASTTDAQTSAVRMSFTTDRPFFPYREPASQRQSSDLPRVLKVWFIGPERVRGRVGGNAWTGTMFWSEAIRDLEVGGVKVNPDARMTAFEDHATPRPGVDDLYFERDADQATLVPPPKVEPRTEMTNVPADLILLPLAAVGFVVWRKRRRGASSSSRA